MKIGTRIKNLRKALNIAQIDLANRVGVSKQNLYKYENGIITNIPADKIEALAIELNTTPGYLTGWDDRFPQDEPETTTFQIVGDISAGYNGNADIIWDDSDIEIPNRYLKGSIEDYIVLRIKGDSMFPDYQDGDCVLIHKQSTLDHSGQIGAVIFDSNSATLKRVEFVKGQDWMRLIPINSAYPTVKISLSPPNRKALNLLKAQ